MALIVFIVFVVLVLIVSSRAGRGKTATSGGYYAANSSIHWGVNGIAFAGGYLSVASFLGIAGLIAFFGYDGFLYSIGFLAGWIVALFVIAEPMKRMGTFTFSDALNKNYNRPGIQLAAGLSVLVVSLVYLVPQMVGAGVLVEPLLGIPHYIGVIIVGAVVIFLVAGGGMTSTTYVQFFNGGLLLTFASVLTIAVLVRGVDTTDLPREEGPRGLESYRFEHMALSVGEEGGIHRESLAQTPLRAPEILTTHVEYDEYTGEPVLRLYQLSRLIPAEPAAAGEYTARVKGRTVKFDANRVEEVDGAPFVRIEDWWRLEQDPRFLPTGTEAELREAQSITTKPDGTQLVNGVEFGLGAQTQLRQMGRVSDLPDGEGATGAVGPIGLLSVLSDENTSIQLARAAGFRIDGGTEVSVYYEKPVAGDEYMRPGMRFPVIAREGEPEITTRLNRLNFISLMLALFLGTSALPHILIRYYTVPSAAAARKSTIVAIAGIGLFYVLTMYLGVGALVGGANNPLTDNMSAPLLARSFNEPLFAVVSGIAFTTVLATTSGLIMAASGTVAHDLMVNLVRREIPDKTKVFAGRIVAVVVGVIGIGLGIAFRGVNVSYLVGWAFAVAASANLPSLLFMLFWKRTTAAGIIASILVGLVSSVGLILIGPDMWGIYGLDPAQAPMPLDQPGIISIPLSFITIIVVSLATQKEKPQQAAPAS